MNKKKTAGVLFSLTLFFLFFTVGCMKQSLPVYYYTLGPSGQSAVHSTDSSLPPITVGPIHIASFLDQGHIITQNSAYSVNIAEQHRWAGDLPEMLSNVMTQNLRLDLKTDRIYTFSGSHNSKGLQLLIEFLHFEKDSDGNGLVTARWKLLSEGDGIPLHSSTSSFRTTPETDGFEPLSEALSRGLAKLSGEIAGTIYCSPHVKGTYDD
jgi:uncharacterized protein